MRYFSIIFFALFLTLAGCGSDNPETEPVTESDPVFSSDSEESVSENQIAAYTAVATDADGDTLEYSLSGTDVSWFSIDASSGVVSFNTEPDYENPQDADSNNAYLLIVTASDGVNSTEQPVTVTVVNLVETTLSGRVGIVQNANVAAYSIEEGGVSETNIGTAVTDSDGFFTMDIEYSAEVIYLVVSGNDLATTLMQCNLESCGEAEEADSVDTDASGTIDFGEWQVVGTDFELITYVGNWEEGDEIRVNLLTHLAATSFDTPPSLTELEAEYLAIEEALDLFQSPDEVDFVDVTDETAETDDLSDTLIAAALLSLVEDEFESVDLAASIDALEELLDGESLAESDEVALSEISAEALNIAENLPEETAGDVTDKLKTINEEAADEENTLVASDLPLMPDFSLSAQ